MTVTLTPCGTCGLLEELPSPCCPRCGSKDVGEPVVYAPVESKP